MDNMMKKRNFVESVEKLTRIKNILLAMRVNSKTISLMDMADPINLKEVIISSIMAIGKMINLMDGANLDHSYWILKLDLARKPFKEEDSLTVNM